MELTALLEDRRDLAGVAEGVKSVTSALTSGTVDEVEPSVADRGGD